MSITKNKLSPEEIRDLCHAAFPGRAIVRITELTEGMFNAASRIDLQAAALRCSRSVPPRARGRA